jgi:hypothetical protein
MINKMKALIACTNCSAPLDRESFNQEALAQCPSCGVMIRADVFPAIFKGLSQGTAGELLLFDDEASCFYHQNKRAVVACASCGRFLCSLCDVDFNDRHLCPTCLDVGKKKGKIQNLENHRILYDNLCLALAIGPLIIWPATILTAPLTIYFVIRFWKMPSSIIKRSKIRQVIALLIAVIQITGMSFLIYSVSFK